VENGRDWRTVYLRSLEAMHQFGGLNVDGAGDIIVAPGRINKKRGAQTRNGAKS